MMRIGAFEPASSPLPLQAKDLLDITFDALVAELTFVDVVRGVFRLEQIFNLVQLPTVPANIGARTLLKQRLRQAEIRTVVRSHLEYRDLATVAGALAGVYLGFVPAKAASVAQHLAANWAFDFAIHAALTGQGGWLKIFLAMNFENLFGINLAGPN